MMPVEIRELIIRAVVKDEPNTARHSDSEPYQQQDTQAIVADCVKQVLKVLQRKQER